jgi:hypothetical protein
MHLLVEHTTYMLMVIEFAMKALYNKWQLRVNNHYEALT